jgi:hypothetical protein
MLHNAIDELDYDHDERWCVAAHTRPNFPHVTCQSSMHHVPVARLDHIGFCFDDVEIEVPDKHEQEVADVNQLNEYLADFE